MSITLKKTFAVAVVAALAAACQTETPEQAGTTDEIAVDTETIQQAIEARGDQAEQAFLTGDPAAIVPFYTADAVIMAPYMPRAEGTDAITTFWTDMMAQGPLDSVTLTTDRVIVPESGDLVVEIGTYQISGTTPDGTWQETGKRYITWQNVDGEWKVAVDAFSSDTPPPGMEGDAGTEDPAAETN